MKYELQIWSDETVITNDDGTTYGRIKMNTGIKIRIIADNYFAIMTSNKVINLPTYDLPIEILEGEVKEQPEPTDCSEESFKRKL